MIKDGIIIIGFAILFVFFTSMIFQGMTGVAIMTECKTKYKDLVYLGNAEC